MGSLHGKVTDMTKWLGRVCPLQEHLWWGDLEERADVVQLVGLCEVNLGVEWKSNER